MTKEKIEAITPEDIKNIMAQYHAGEVSRKDAMLFMCELLENYIKSRCVKTGRINGAEMDDLLQSGYEAIIKQFDRYDAEQTLPSSFFTPYIDEYTKGQCRHSNPRSQYYTTLITKLNKVAQQYGFEGMNDPNLTEDMLAVLAKVQLHSVIEAKKFSNYTIVHSDAGELTEGANFDTPEKAMMQKADSQALLESIDMLTAQEKWIISKLHFEDEPMSYRAMIAEIKASEKLSALFADVTITQVYLEQVYNDAIRALKNSQSIKNLGYRRSQQPVLEYAPSEQATDKELECGILAGYITL